MAAPGKVGAKDIVSRDEARERGLLYYYQSLEAWKKIRWALGKRRPKALVTYCRRGMWPVRGRGAWTVVDRYQMCSTRYGLMSEHAFALFREGGYRSADAAARSFRNRVLTHYRRRDPQVRLSQSMAHALRGALKRRGVRGRGSRWESLVGYTVQELQQHLESQFQRGMAWDNMGKWHIDHIRPQSSFSFSSTDDPEFKECWALANLQPLWAADNLRKSAKRHWQPTGVAV